MASLPIGLPESIAFGEGFESIFAREDCATAAACSS
jgi:hypothetical protein